MMLKTIKDQYMQPATNNFPKYACQFCGCERKFVETIIDDEFFWDDVNQIYQPNRFTDMFEHTGNQRCAECNKDWTGYRLNP